MAIDFLCTYAPLLMRGASMTLVLWTSASIISLTMGTVLGVVRSSRFRMPIISPCADFLTFIGRGVPYYVQLLVAYFVLPGLIGIDAPVLLVAALSLGLCSASYVSQIVRGTINTVPAGQWEAAYVLGLSAWQTGRFVVLPQTMPALVPACVSECDQILKSTAIFASVGILELTRAGMNIVSQTIDPIPVYLAIAIVYLIFSSVLNLVGYYVERSQNKGWL